MSAAFHHGTETKRIDGGTSPIYTADGAITAMVGTAPAGAVNTLTVCAAARDFLQFGSSLTGKGFTLPDAANIFTRYKAGTAYVANVCDPAKHKSSVADEALTVDTDTLTARTAHPALQTGYTVKDGASALNEGSDYTVTDALAGEIVFKTKPTTPTISYTYTDPSKVTEEEIIGAYVAATGQRTGLQAVIEGFNRFGADAKIIIVPEYDKTAKCRAAIEVLAEQIKAIGYAAAPQQTTLSKAIEGRGPFPTVSHIKNFEVAQRTGDVIDESIRRFELQYIDRPIDDALIDSLLGSIRTYLGTLQSIVGYSVDLDYDYDLVDAFSKGQVPIKYEYTPKLPAERISNASVMTRKYLANLVSQR